MIDLDVFYRQSDWQNMLPKPFIQDERRKTLVLYNNEDGSITVCSEADDEYKYFAALHEKICMCGKCAEHFPLNMENRCAEIERFVIGQARLVGYDRVYIGKRKMMFSLLKDMGVWQQSFDATVRVLTEEGDEE